MFNSLLKSKNNIYFLKCMFFNRKKWWKWTILSIIHVNALVLNFKKILYKGVSRDAPEGEEVDEGVQLLLHLFQVGPGLRLLLQLGPALCWLVGPALVLLWLVGPGLGLLRLVGPALGLLWLFGPSFVFLSDLSTWTLAGYPKVR